MNREEKKDIKIDKIIRSKRKTVMIQITKDARLIVRAPKYTPNFAIKVVVQKHQAWIEKKRELVRERAEKFKNKKFKDNEEFLFLGQSYKLFCVSKDGFRKKFKQGSTLLETQRQGRSLVFDDKAFFLLSGVSDPKKVFESWYKKRAREILVPRVRELSEKHKFLYNKIRITSAQTRWGSCSSKKNLNFSWRLVMAPQKTIDYVIIHELVHTKHMNHSKFFWGAVEGIVPDYKKHKKWLNGNPMRECFD
ncbi:MAG: M48 family metallopeptidase [Candidatus Pacebacteria bacterium]|nr:M48 family metallopeptidase [Candidatus Paceibacterota bacterium]